jgi:hypothetical protein
MPGSMSARGSADATTVFSSHLFDGHTIRKWTTRRRPTRSWAVREDGVLLGLTSASKVGLASARHARLLWDVCVVPEADGDAVYLIVRRTIDAATVRYIERMVKREIRSQFRRRGVLCDAGLSYSGAPVNNVTGLGHLQGQVVAVVGDGAVIFNGDPTAANAADFTITAGGTFPVVFPASYSNIHVGLRYIADLETLDLDVQGVAVRERQKAVGPVQVLIDRSSREFSAGPDVANLRRYTRPTWEPAADEFTGQVEISTTKRFGRYGRVFIRQSDPLPLTILGVIPNVELGG